MSYAIQQQSAFRMIQRKGVQTTLTRIAAAAVDEAHDVATGGGPQTQTVLAVSLPATESRDLTIEQKSDLRLNQRRVLIAPLLASGAAFAWEPQPNHTIKLEGKLWTVKALSRLAPDGGIPVLFDAEVRK